MGAVALSQGDEKILESLQKTLEAPSKSQVIHRALETLQREIHRGQLAREIQRSVQKCGKADQRENRSLTGAALSRLEEK